MAEINISNLADTLEKDINQKARKKEIKSDLKRMEEIDNLDDDQIVEKVELEEELKRIKKGDSEENKLLIALRSLLEADLNYAQDDVDIEDDLREKVIACRGRSCVFRYTYYQEKIITAPFPNNGYFVKKWADGTKVVEAAQMFIAVIQKCQETMNKLIKHLISLKSNIVSRNYSGATNDLNSFNVLLNSMECRNYNFVHFISLPNSRIQNIVYPGPQVSFSSFHSKLLGLDNNGGTAIRGKGTTRKSGFIKRNQKFSELLNKQP